MTVVATLPQTTINPGSGGATSGLIASDAHELRAVLAQVGWPAAHDKAIDYWLEYSNDSGATWRVLSLGDIWDYAEPGNSITMSCGIPNVGSATRKVRLSWTFYKTLTISGTVNAL